MHAGSGEFPRRRLPNGRLVKTYEELLAHILGKDPGIQMRELPFEGRNKVLWITQWTDAQQAHAEAAL
jgi:hypothetical protein